MGYLDPFPRGTVVSQQFGSNPGGYNPPGGHTGRDYAVPIGTPIRAAAEGVIRNSGWLTDNYLANDWWLTRMGGDTLVLDCVDVKGRSDTMPTFIYAHLSDSTAQVGELVRKGQVIGYSGNSGTATSGPHCHVEMLPPNWDWGNGTYGRINPQFTEYWDPTQINPAGDVTPEPQELFTMGQYENLLKQIGLAHEKENNIADLLNRSVAADRKYHGQTHAKVNAIREVVDQIAAGQGVTIDWARVEAAAKAGAAEALAEGVDINLNVNGKATVNGKDS